MGGVFIPSLAECTCSVPINTQYVRVYEYKQTDAVDAVQYASDCAASNGR